MQDESHQDTTPWREKRTRSRVRAIEDNAEGKGLLPQALDLDKGCRGRPPGHGFGPDSSLRQARIVDQHRLWGYGENPASRVAVDPTDWL